MNSFQDKVRGVLLGTAYGDALGAPIEKLSYEEIKQQYGRVSSLKTKWYKEDYAPEVRLNRMRGNGIVTDDTLMTLALIDTYSTLERHLDAYDMGGEFIKEIAFKERYIPEFGRNAMIQDRIFYPEKYIFLRHVLANCEPREGGIGNMVNCGAAMYIAPVGVVNACNPRGAYEEAIAFAMGHQCSYGLEAAGVLAACVAKAFEHGVTIQAIIDTALEYAKDGTKEAIYALVNEAEKIKGQKKDKDFVVANFHKVIAQYSPMGNDVKRQMNKVGLASNHYVPSRLSSIEELPLALGFLNLHDGDFQDAVLDGINSGRDTDSIGVMIGVISGAMYGSSIVSANDIDLLEQANQLNLLKNADRFYQTVQKIVDNDLSANQVRQSMIESMVRGVKVDR
ncbi:ADP-ribosylglycohydrolase family protein [Peribacillus muralis]|uniref:ADP-ribosylglycohydrolase family protein n=1 Tax=Peribacillus muralis TaxID=264697 RepID=UPI001F4E2F86|nr:ADP-ribosylglycohydrolase family protein [Peribacillus muralis]MCK2013843.1 ADP-ribosylglycohydrolase family protein [Peribacillus muralis]